MQQITVQTLKPPLPGKTNGGFMGTDGKFYKCELATYQRLVEGMTFESNVKPSDYNGQTYYWLPKGFMPPANGAQPGSYVPLPPGTRPDQIIHQPPRTVDRDVSITQQTLLKAFIGTGQFGLLDLPALEEACTASAKRLVKAAS